MGIFGPNVRKLEAKKDIPGLIAALSNPDSNVVKSATEALQRMGWPAIEHIMQLIGDGKRYVFKMQATKALGSIGGLAVGPLIELLRKGDVSTKIEARQALVGIGGTAVKPLIRLLKDETHFLIQRDALIILVEIGKPATEPLYEAMMDEGWQHVRLQLAIALGNLGDNRALKPLLQALRQGNAGEDVAKAIDNLGWSTEDAVERAYYLIAKGQWGIEEFRQELFRLGVSAVEPLIELLKRRDKHSRKQAIEFLGLIPDERSVEPLIAFLNDEDSAIRQEAAVALGKINDSRAIEPLSHTMIDEDKNVRRNAANALRLLKAGDVVIQALKNPDSRVRMTAAQTLSDILDEEVKQALYEVSIHDEDRAVREAASESLRYITNVELDLGF